MKEWGKIQQGFWQLVNIKKFMSGDSGFLTKEKIFVYFGELNRSKGKLKWCL